MKSNIPIFILFLSLLSLVCFSCENGGDVELEKEMMYSEDKQKVEKREILVDDWLGFFFQDKKIGYLHNQISKVGNGYETEALGVMRVDFQGNPSLTRFTQKATLDDDLFLKSFFYEFDSFGKTISFDGRRVGDKLVVQIANAGVVATVEEEFLSETYSSSSVRLMLIRRGLKLGDSFNVKVFFEPLQKIADLNVEVVAEEPIDYDGKRVKAYKVMQRVSDLHSTSWYTHDGKLIKEESFEGFRIVASSEEDAKAFEGEGLDLNKLLVLTEVKTAGQITDQNRTQELKVALKNIKDVDIIPESYRQQIIKKDVYFEKGEKLHSITLRLRKEEIGKDGAYEIPINRYKKYLKPTPFIQSDDPLIKNKAIDILKGEKNSYMASRKIMTWMRQNINLSWTENFSALDTLKSGEGECQSNSYLYAAFLRSLGIPCKISIGVVYSAENKSFMYHAWCEAYLGEWVSIDPTFNQLPADVTHITLLEGGWSELLKMLQFIGKLKIDILELHYDKV